MTALSLFFILGLPAWVCFHVRYYVFALLFIVSPGGKRTLAR